MSYLTAQLAKIAYKSASGGVMLTEGQWNDFVDSVHTGVVNVEVLDGVDSTGTTDSSAGIQSLSGQTSVIFPDGTYEFFQVKLGDMDISGQNWPTFRAVGAAQEVLELQTNVILERVIIDGEGDSAMKLQLGGDPATGAEHVVFQHSRIKDCPVNSARIENDIEGVYHLFNRSDGSKAFNTGDLSTFKNFTIIGGQFLGIPIEGGLIDPSKVENPLWHGVTHIGCQYEMAENGQRAFSVARTIGFNSYGNTYRGEAGVSKDLIHIEDKAEKGLFCGELVDTNGAPIAVDGAPEGDNAFADNDPKNVAFMSLALFCDGTAKGFFLQGSAPGTFERITIDGAHIDQPTIPVDARLTEGAVINTVSYDPQAPIRIDTSQFIDNNTEDSPVAHNIYVTGNHAIRPTYIRGDVGVCFDPNNLLFSYSFANEGTFPAAPTGGPGNSRVTGTGGSLGTGGTVTYPLSVAGDGITGCKYHRATAGTTAMTRRIDIDFTPELEDIQNGDCISVQLMCRSSVANRGRVVIGFPGAGPSNTDYDLPTTTDWQVLGATKKIDEADDLFAGTGITIDIFVGEDLANTETFDLAWIKVSHVRGY